MHVLLQIAKRRLAMLGGFVLGIGIVALVAPSAALEFDGSELPADSASVSRADRLIDRYGCWSGEAPADMTGKLPGHVVVTTSAGRAVYSARLVGPALDQTFGGPDAGLFVHAFCR